MRLSFNNRLIGIVPPLSQRKQNQTRLIALDFRSRPQNYGRSTDQRAGSLGSGVKIRMAASVTAIEAPKVLGHVFVGGRDGKSTDSSAYSGDGDNRSM